MIRILCFGLLTLCSPARADEPVVIRMSTVAPAGSPWARELTNFARQVESSTHEQVRIKLYLNAVAGDELEQLEHMKKGRMDGSASGQMACERLAPTLRVSRLPGVFQDRDEAERVLSGLRPVIDKEAHENGFTVLGITGLGPSVFFTRTPVHNLAELRKVRLWRWAADEVGTASSREMGLNLEPLPLYEASRAYDEKRVDGWLGIPAAALAFQWSAQARYLIDLRNDYLFGCVLVADRAFTRLPVAHQAAIRDAAARLSERYMDLGRRIDDQLLGGLFQKQGLTSLPVSDSFRAEFFDAARAARAKMAERFVSRDLLNRVQGMLADYRAEHPNQR
jgi:TRAP-type C4-dicarboxylate transport system substrate-binding protein